MVSDENLNKLEEYVTNEAEEYGNRRKLEYKSKKKITPHKLATEIKGASILGELRSAERLLRAIVENKEWSRSDIEAELHLFVTNLACIASATLDGTFTVELEDVLRMYDYL